MVPKKLKIQWMVEWRGMLLEKVSKLATLYEIVMLSLSCTTMVWPRHAPFPQWRSWSRRYKGIWLCLTLREATWTLRHSCGRASWMCLHAQRAERLKHDNQNLSANLILNEIKFRCGQPWTWPSRLSPTFELYVARLKLIDHCINFLLPQAKAAPDGTEFKIRQPQPWWCNSKAHHCCIVVCGRLARTKLIEKCMNKFPLTQLSCNCIGAQRSMVGAPAPHVALPLARALVVVKQVNTCFSHGVRQWASPWKLVQEMVGGH